MREQLLSLLKKEAFFKKKITLSSGKTSNYYLDVRKVSLTPAGVYLISQLIFDLIKDEGVSAIGGPTLGADPIVGGVCFLAHQKGVKLKGFLIRKSPKAHGQQQMIEGPGLLAQDKVVLIDDVATSGSSIVKAVEVLKAENIKIVKAIVVVDREEGAKETLQELGCPLVSLFKKSDFLED